MTDQLSTYASIQGGIWSIINVAVRSCLVFSIAATYPVQLFVVTDIVENEFIFKGRFYQAKTKKIIVYVFRALLVIGSVLVAVSNIYIYTFLQRNWDRGGFFH